MSGATRHQKGGERKGHGPMSRLDAIDWLYTIPAESAHDVKRHRLL